MSNSLITQQEKEKYLNTLFDKDKVILHCPEHKYSYGDKRQPTPGCKGCWMVSFTGLMCNIPPERRLEVMEMLEYSIHKLVEADEKGQIDRFKLFKRPQVSFEKGKS
jgi:hypothetical protein